MATLCLLGLIAALSPSCTSTHDVVYARATKLPEEANGFMRVAQEEDVLINVVGTDVVARRPIAGYLVVHEQDAAAFVRNTQTLLRLLGKHPELAAEAASGAGK